MEVKIVEARLQAEIIHFLKRQGAYVIKTRPQPGTPTGCPDVFAFYRDRFVAIEVKASANAPFRVGQQYTLKLLGKNNQFVFVAYPENWSEIKSKLKRFFLV